MEAEEMEKKLRDVIRRYNKDKNDPFFKTRKGKEIFEILQDMDKIMGGKGDL